MVHRTPATFLEVAQSINADPASATTTNGSSVDCRHFDGGYAVIVVSTGTLVGSGHTVSVKIQESSDDGSSDAFADVSGTTFDDITASNDVATYVGSIRLRGRERYLRAVATTTGTVTSGDIVVQIILMKPADTSVADGTYAFDI